MGAGAGELGVKGFLIIIRTVHASHATLVLDVSADTKVCRHADKDQDAECGKSAAFASMLLVSRRLCDACCCGPQADVDLALVVPEECDGPSRWRTSA